VDGDRPINRLADDRLGFGPVAQYLARAIVDQAAKDGLVFGVEGRWGSGKSTLINLTIEALKQHGPSAPEVIAFSPWLVGDRDGLLKTLFDELATAAVKIDPLEKPEQIDVAAGRWEALIPKQLRPDPHTRLKQKEKLKRDLGDRLKTFGNLAGTMGKLAKAAGALGLTGADLAGSAIEKSGQAARSFFEGAPLAKRKQELVEALRLLSRRIIVFVDDLDRLEPSEASEVLRLIRAVADFPNVIYVLSYDADVLAQTLKQAVQIDDGRAFLEKIVQVSFKVPQPEAFDLRRWFESEVWSIFASELRSDSSSNLNSRARLSYAIDTHGGRYLQTARDVIRVLNLLRLHAVPVRDRIDLADMVWLQLVRVGNPDLYTWIEEYVTEVAAIANRATMSEQARRKVGDSLRVLLAAESSDVEYELIELGQFLPGVGGGHVGYGSAGQEPQIVFNNLGDFILNKFIREKRLGSPQHYRYYFAFTEPAGALRDEQVSAFVDTAKETLTNAIDVFGDLAKVLRPQGGSMAEVLIDRLQATSQSIPTEAIAGILAAMAASMDDLARSSKDSDFGYHRGWPAAERLVESLLRRTSGELRAKCLTTLFSDGRALGWLTGILRQEIFGHGHYGQEAKPEEQRLLSGEEFQNVLTVMLQRYRDTAPDELMRTPNLTSLLFGWKQGGDPDEPRNWVGNQTVTDEGLLRFLARARGWSSSSGEGVYYPLRRRDLESFLDFDQAVARLHSIAQSTAVSDAERRIANELIAAVNQGENR